MFPLSGKETTQKQNLHKQIWGVVPGLDGWQSFVYVMGASGVIPYKGGKTHTMQNPQKICEILVYRRRLVRAPVGTRVLRRVLRRGGVIKGT